MKSEQTFYKATKMEIRREQTFDTSREARFFLHIHLKHGWRGYVEPDGDKFRVVIFC